MRDAAAHCTLTTTTKSHVEIIETAHSIVYTFYNNENPVRDYHTLILNNQKLGFLVFLQNMWELYKVSWKIHVMTKKCMVFQIFLAPTNFLNQNKVFPPWSAFILCTIPLKSMHYFQENMQHFYFLQQRQKTGASTPQSTPQRDDGACCGRSLAGSPAGWVARDGRIFSGGM